MVGVLTIGLMIQVHNGGVNVAVVVTKAYKLFLGIWAIVIGVHTAFWEDRDCLLLKPFQGGVKLLLALTYQKLLCCRVLLKSLIYN